MAQAQHSEQATQNEQPRQKSWTIISWWEQRGEPLLLTALVGAGATLGLLHTMGMLGLTQLGQALLVLVWLAGLLWLRRLPGLLARGQEARRLFVLAGLTGVGIMSVVLTQAVTPLQPGFVQAGAFGEQPGGEERLIGLRQDQAADSAELTFKSPPRISREMFAQLLQQGTGGGGTSPAAPVADDLYDILVDYELDPAVALAFFAQESQFCTTGLCAQHDMKSWGGQRAAYDPSRAAGTVSNSTGPFVSFATWEDSVADWSELILNFYVDRGLDTVEKAIPVYAPASDGNDTNNYINAVRRRVAVWRGQDPGTITDYDVHAYDNLETGLLSEAFRASGLDYNPEWAFHQYMVTEAQAGRPLGSPLDESRRITVGDQAYVIQTFALDTLYTPLAAIENQTNWSDVRRLSDLLRQGQGGQGISNGPTYGGPSPTPANTPTPTPVIAAPVQFPR